MDFYYKIQVLLDVALGIKSMHSKQIAHNSISLQNVCKFDDSWKIIDFSQSIDSSNTSLEIINN